MSRGVSEFTQLLAMTRQAAHSKINEDGGLLTVVPSLTYCVKKFAPNSKDLIHTSDLVDCLGVLITDRTTNSVAVAHFHPINCFSKEVTKISLEKIKEDFIGIGGNMAETKVRIIGGVDSRLRTIMKNACEESLECKQISHDGFFNRDAFWDSTHAIIAADRSYIARIENHRLQRPQDSSIITTEMFRAIDVLGPEDREIKERIFFEKCTGVARSAEQKSFKTKTILVCKKIIKDDLGLVEADHSLNPGSSTSFSVTRDTYEGLIRNEVANPIGPHVAQDFCRKGCGLISVDEMVRYNGEERGR
ncbi:MAG: hypothetical protein KA100_00160 [Rickettsiales bacterium]|nr:hypothetical protein [Rickettsiales bacterium]